MYIVDSDFESEDGDDENDDQISDSDCAEVISNYVADSIGSAD